MKLSFILKTPLLLSLLNCFTIFLCQSQEKYRFGNNFIFDQISTDARFMIRSHSPIMIQDSFLYSALTTFYQFPGLPKELKENKNKTKKPITSLSGKSVDTFQFEQGQLITNAESFTKPKSPIILGVKLNPNLTDFFSREVKSISKSFSSYIINDSSEAIVIAMGITTENVDDYQYHVIENDSVEIIPWSPIPKLEQKYGAWQPYAFLGKYKAPGKQLLIEVKNCKNYYIRDGVLLDWKVNFKPVVEQIIVGTPTGYFNLNFRKLNRNFATVFDKVSGLPLNLRIPCDSVEVFQIHFKNHLTIPYAIFLRKEINGSIDTSEIEWYCVEDNFRFNEEHFNKAGKYELIIQRTSFLNSYGEENMLRIPFEVFQIDSSKATNLKIIRYGLEFIILLLFSFLSYYFYNKRKLKTANRLKEQTTLKLKSIRSQLNPHFMFNALGSIQGLMNKNDIEAANNYLSRFANLTRKVLDTSENELISLSDELKILEDYLYMEQLRFGFQYVINTETDLNQANIEIPAMLIQPFVENAVKHGISALDGNGRIQVAISKSGNNLVLLVIDNGKGFLTEKINGNAGLGLKLCKERIALLNKTYTGQKISMDIVSDMSGTQVKVTLCNWL